MNALLNLIKSEAIQWTSQLGATMGVAAVAAHFALPASATADLTTMLVGLIGAAFMGYQQKSAAPVVAEAVKDMPGFVSIVANATAKPETVVH